MLEVLSDVMNGLFSI